MNIAFLIDIMITDFYSFDENKYADVFTWERMVCGNIGEIIIINDMSFISIENYPICSVIKSEQL